MDKTDERRAGAPPNETLAVDGPPRLDPATPEVAAHGQEEDDGPETEGHLLQNPYLIANSGDQRRDEALRAAERERQNRGKTNRGLADRLRGRIQGRDDV